MVDSVVRLRASAPCCTAEPSHWSSPCLRGRVGRRVRWQRSEREACGGHRRRERGPGQHDDLDEVRCDLDQQPAWPAAGNVTTTILATPPPPVYRSPVQHGSGAERRFNTEQRTGSRAPRQRPYFMMGGQGGTPRYPRSTCLSKPSPQFRSLQMLPRAAVPLSVQCAH